MRTRQYDPARSTKLPEIGPETQHSQIKWPESDGALTKKHWRQNRRPVLSVVVAAKNEARNLPQLVDEIAQALRLFVLPRPLDS